MESPKIVVSAENTPSKECFVIAPIGEPGSPTRIRADQVLQYVIGEALRPLGYKVLRADKISEPGYITIQVLQKLQSSALTIADLTERNANVFYELAALHSMARPAVIHIVDDAERIPFDVTGLRLVKFNYKDLKSVGDAKIEIQEHARQIERGVLGDNPITLAGMAHRLAISEGQDKLVAQGLGRILEELSGLRAEMRASQEIALYQMSPYVPEIVNKAVASRSIPVSSLMGYQRASVAGTPIDTPVHATDDGMSSTGTPILPRAITVHGSEAKPSTNVTGEARKKKDAENTKD
jgi:hypothetical protein